jgi:glucose-1-phosphate adenylyltransferase
MRHHGEVLDIGSHPRRVLSVVLAGGEGKRLMPLTIDRAKPAVPFGGHYRLIDFALSNLANGGFRRIVVLTQYKSHSLDVHLSKTWRLSTLLGNYVTSVPAQMRKGPRWFLGSADALFQNLNLIDDEQPDHLFVFGADHIYRMDPAQMLAQHLETGAGVTVAGLRVPIGESASFGVIERAPHGTEVRAFLEKPTDPPGLTDAPDQVLASMGNYVFDVKVLVDALHRDAEDPSSTHDIGGNLIPRLVGDGVAHVYDFSTNIVPGDSEDVRGYWRDVGTLDAYYDAHMDLVRPQPVFNLYNGEWPIFTTGRSLPPAKLVTAEGDQPSIDNSLLCNGAIVSGSTVRHSVLSPGVRVERGAVVDGAVLLDDVHVGAGAVVRRAVIDKNVRVPPGCVIGEDVDCDRERFAVSEGGVVAIGKNVRID